MSQAQQTTKPHAKGRSGTERKAELDEKRDRLAVQLDAAIQRADRAQRAVALVLEDLRDYPELAGIYRLAQANAEGIEALRLLLQRGREHVKPRKEGAPDRPPLH